MTDQPTTQIPAHHPRTPSDPSELANLIHHATRDRSLPDLWTWVVEDHGYTDALNLWEAAHREILAGGRPRGEAPVRPGDRSTEGLAVALLAFIRAAGLGGSDAYHGEFRSASSAYDADLSVHVPDLELAAAVGHAFGFVHEPFDHVLHERRAVHHHHRGTWQGYRVDVVAVDPAPPAPDDAAPPSCEPAGTTTPRA